MNVLVRGVAPEQSVTYSVVNQLPYDMQTLAHLPQYKRHMVLVGLALR